MCGVRTQKASMVAPRFGLCEIKGFKVRAWGSCLGLGFRLQGSGGSGFRGLGFRVRV